MNANTNTGAENMTTKTFKTMNTKTFRVTGTHKDTGTVMSLVRKDLTEAGWTLGFMRECGYINLTLETVGVS